ncbi:MAG: FtsW/RodA/SpoVE family cell cycle protein, partial [Lachnospiraceae bacterium]|nr:FtsW/RodA/SpoVE family cell cycle protein [Lachnospiraceae bacterium]
MREEKVFQPGLRGLDTNLLAALFFVMVFGFVMIYSASYYTAGLSAAYNYDSMYLLKNQVAYSLIGIAAMFVVSNINYHVWSIFAIPGYVVCILLILLLRTPLGVTVKGATRWLRIGGIQFQVAEPVKLIMIVVMATLIVVRGRQLKSWLSILRMMVPSLIVSLLILRISNNMSTAAILLGMTVFMIYIVHPDQWRFFLVAAIGIAAVAAIVYYVKNLDPATLEDAGFRFARIRAWLEP